MHSKAFERGREQYPWWPDWRDKPVVIIASGPSTGRFNFEALKAVDVGVIAIKASIDKVPWAQVLYGCDAPWWVSRRGMPEYKGIRLAHGPKALVRFPELINRVDIDTNRHVMLVEKPLHIGSGKNSGFQALNLAVQFGANKILLVGFDYNGRSGLHWYGRSQWQGASNPTDLNFRVWTICMNDAAPWFKQHAIDVINASPHSDLKCFRHGGLQEIIAHASAA